MDPIARHRREFRLKIAGPVVLGAAVLLALVIVLFVLVAADAMQPRQVTTVSSVMLTVCIFFPLTILCAIIDVALILMAWGSAKIPAAIHGPLASLRMAVRKAADLTVVGLGRITRPLIKADVRLTRWGYVIGAFLRLPGERPAEAPQEDESGRS